MDDSLIEEVRMRNGGPAHDPALITRLDRALLRMRHTVVRPETTAVPIPALSRTVDLAKVLACLAISDLADLDDAGAAGSPVTVKDVALALSLEHSTASRLLAEAEAEGLVERSTDPTDRRRTQVRLTGTGDAVVQQSSAIRTWAFDAILAGWDTEQLRTFTELVEKFSDTIEERSAAVIHAAMAHFAPPR